IAGPSGQVGGPFETTIVFDMDVTDFDATDISVQGGEVTDLRGSGYYYVARISPAAPEVVVTVPQDAANAGGLGSTSPAPLVLGFIDTLPPSPVFSGPAAGVN